MKKIIYLCLIGFNFYYGVSAEERNFGKAIPETDQVINVFKPAIYAASKSCPSDDRYCCPAGMECRWIPKIPFDNAEITKHKPVHVGKRAHQEEHALSLHVIFDFDSADLTDEAKEQLKPIGEAMLSNELQTLSFKVEGHTDALGDSGYNKLLSRNRAASVKAYLIEEFEIDASRLKVLGMGESHLLDPLHPDNEENRRVRIVATP